MAFTIKNKTKQNKTQGKSSNTSNIKLGLARSFSYKYCKERKANSTKTRAFNEMRKIM